MSGPRALGPLVCAVAFAAGVRLGAERWGDPLRRAAFGTSECSRVALRGHARVPAAELALAAALEPGTKVLAVDPDEVAARLRTHPWVVEARVRRMPPFHLLVEVVERAPVAVAEGIGGEPFLVDRSGVRFAPAQPEHLESLPLLHGLAAEAADAAPEVAEAARVADLLERHGLPAAAQIWLGRAAAEEGLALVLRGETARILLGGARASDGLRRLARSRAAGLAEVAAADTIDLRFAGRVVLRSRPPPGGGAAVAERGRATPLTRSPSG
jgi:cell division protein FtsQ